MRAFSALVLVLLGTTAASAQTLSVRSQTVYHAYEIPLAPEGPDLGNRNLNRFYTTLNLSAWGLGDAGDVDAVIALRYDTDFGTGFQIDTPMGFGIPATDGRDDLDLMYAYVDWRNIVTGRLHARLGRQVIIDDLAWYSIDGVQLQSKLWRNGDAGWDLDLYVGVPVRFDVVFSSEPFLNDGTQVDDGEGFFHGLAVGGRSALRLSRDLQFSISYRQELKFRADELEAFGGDTAAAAASAGSIGLQESRLGLSGGYTIRDWRTDVYASLVWDTLVGAIEQARVGASYNPMAGVHAQLEYLRVRPRFAGDSIFNWFNIFGYDRARAEVSVELLPGLTVQGGYLLQAFGGGATARAGTEFAGSDWTHGPSGGVTYRRPRFGLGVYGEAATNTNGAYAYGGNYRAGWLWGDVSFFDQRLVADARLSLTTVQTDLFEGIDQGEVAPADTSVNVQVGGRGRITDHLSARVFVVRNMGQLLEGSYRVYSELTVTY